MEPFRHFFLYQESHEYVIVVVLASVEYIKFL
jgi:hypothetical protein